MKANNNPSTLFWQAFKKNERREKFSELFRNKSFEEANLRKYQVAFLTGYLANLISIITGFSFLYYAFSAVLFNHFGAGKNLFSIILSIVILVLIEFFKRESIGLLTTNFLKENKIVFLSLTFTIALIAGSIFLSVSGVEAYISQVGTNKIQLIDQNFSSQKDSLNKHFKNTIGQVKKEIQDFKEAVSYKGKINIHNNAVKEQIQLFNQKIASLEKQKSKEYNNLEMSHLNGIEGSNKETGSNSKTMMWFALINELSCLLLIYYCYFYAYRSYLESSLVREKESGFISKNEVEQEFNISHKIFQLRPEKEVKERKQIGFDFIKNKDNGLRGAHTNPVTTKEIFNANGFEITCQNCGKVETKKHPLAKFCSDKCRMEFHSNKSNSK